MDGKHGMARFFEATKRKRNRNFASLLATSLFRSFLYPVLRSFPCVSGAIVLFGADDATIFRKLRDDANFIPLELEPFVFLIR